MNIDDEDEGISEESEEEDEDDPEEIIILKARMKYLKSLLQITSVLILKDIDEMHQRNQQYPRSLTSSSSFSIPTFSSPPFISYRIPSMDRRRPASCHYRTRSSCIPGW
jgi:hypothetical protein